MKYDIFISYRRDAFEQANLFATRLKAMGYRVFFDIEALNAGMFNEQLTEVIKGCKDFILILSTGALDRCVNKDDWVRREIECAMSHKKNIIPVMLSGFTWPEPMPDGLENLCLYQAITPIPNVYYDMQVKKLAGYLKSKPHYKRRKGWLIALAAIASAVLLFWIISSITFKPIAKQTAETLSMQVDCIDAMMGTCNNIQVEWEEVLTSLSMAGTKEDSTSVKDDFLKYLNMMEKSLRQTEEQRQTYKVPGNHTFLMSFHISPVDFMVFESGSQFFYKNTETYLYIIQQSLEEDDYSQLRKQLVSGHLETQDIMAEGLYYAYAQLLSHLPKDAQSVFYEMSPKWLNLPTVSLNLEDEEYERLQNIGDEKLRKHVDALRMLNMKNEAELDELQKQLNELKEQQSFGE